jgi:hypothetical protein
MLAETVFIFILQIATIISIDNVFFVLDIYLEWLQLTCGDIHNCYRNEDPGTSVVTISESGAGLEFLKYKVDSNQLAQQFTAYTVERQPGNACPQKGQLVIGLRRTEARIRRTLNER